MTQPIRTLGALALGAAIVAIAALSVRTGPVSGAPTTTVKFVDTPARYIRITQTGSDPDANWWSIQELTLTCSAN